MIKRLLTTLALLAFAGVALTGCATQRASEEPTVVIIPPDEPSGTSTASTASPLDKLTGKWQVHWRGRTYPVKVERIGGNKLSVTSLKANTGVRWVRGKYQVAGKRMTMIGGRSGQTGFVWERRGADKLVLLSPAKYAGAVMRR
jgi:hypothetical protein